jgi:hypothetical protein
VKTLPIFTPATNGVTAGQVLYVTGDVQSLFFHSMFRNKYHLNQPALAFVYVGAIIN